jgi:hypothetical protein
MFFDILGYSILVEKNIRWQKKIYLCRRKIMIDKRNGENTTASV